MIFHLTRQPLAGATSVPLIAATLFWAVIACAQESSMRPSGAQLLVAVEDLDTFSPPYSRAVWKRGDVRRQVL